MALALTTTIQGREFHIFLILILMLLAIYFCHSFVRLFMIASRVPGQINTRVRFAEMEQPIRITFARDVENAAGAETTPTQAIASPPPAYGLWRGSMVRFYLHGSSLFTKTNERNRESTQTMYTGSVSTNRVPIRTARPLQ